jgi:predicted ATPase
LRKAIAFHKEVSLLAFRAWERLYESEFLTRQGRFDDALALAAEAIAQTEEFAHFRSPALLLHADLLGRCAADASTIGAAYRAAIGCARSQGAKYYELQATTSFARCLKSQRRGAEAQTLLAEIYGWFTEGFHTPVIKEAKALLDEMSSEPAMRRRRKLAGNP